MPAAAVLRISPLRPVLRIGRGCSRGQMSHYALLGVEPSADAAQVRAAYRKQAVKFSPDREPERFAPHRQRACPIASGGRCRRPTSLCAAAFRLRLVAARLSLSTLVANA